MVITKLVLPRRTFLRGVGATVALPFLDAMVPAMKAQSGSSGAPRFAAVYIGNGANMAEWTPKTVGANFEMSPILKGIEEYRDRMAVFTNAFDLTAIREVSAVEGQTAARVADLTARLVEKSLLMKLGDSGGYQLLETIRQYGIEQLTAVGELDGLRQRHARGRQLDRER